MTPKASVDQKTRERISANLRKLRYAHKFRSVNAMAEHLGMTRGALNRYIRGEGTPGLDVCLLVHRKLHVSLDWLVDRDPEPEWFDPDYTPKDK